MEERRLYTREEDNYIMDNWTLKSHKEIAEELNRSVKSVVGRHKKLVIRSSKKEDKPHQQEGSSVMIVVTKVSEGENGLPVCQVLSIDNYNVLDYLKQKYDKTRHYEVSMATVISDFVSDVIHSANPMEFCDEFVDALIYSGCTNEHAIRYSLKNAFSEYELNSLCRKVAEKANNKTLNNDNAGYYDMLKVLRSDPVAALTSGKLDERFIGVEVTLPNSAIDCQEWVIADVNHDGTSGTVDLFSKTTLTNNEIVFSCNSQIYDGSSLDTYLESDVYDGFSVEVKNALSLMNMESNGGTIQRHLVTPSAVELGLDISSSKEGTVYPIFNLIPNAKCAFKKPDGKDTWYWTRSRHIVCFGCVFCVDCDGHVNYSGHNCYHNMRAIARIRFAKKED